MRNVPSPWICPAAFDLSAADSRETVPPASALAGDPSSYCTTPSTGYSRLPPQLGGASSPTAAGAGAGGGGRESGRTGGCPPRGRGSVEVGDRLSVVPPHQQ